MSGLQAEAAALKAERRALEELCARLDLDLGTARGEKATATAAAAAAEERAAEQARAKEEAAAERARAERALAVVAAERKGDLDLGRREIAAQSSMTNCLVFGSSAMICSVYSSPDPNSLMRTRSNPRAFTSGSINAVSSAMSAMDTPEIR